MTREDLSQFHGWNVQISLNGASGNAMLHSEDPETAYITPLADSPGWHPVTRHMLTNEEIATMQPNGFQNLFSLIQLKSE